MTQTARGLRPPRLAAWLVELFAPAKEAESILGDLQEEFSDLTSRSGVRFARRWYWRQCVKTVFHLAGAAFWSAPRSLASIVFLGFLLQWFSATLPERLVIAILRTQRPYSNQHVEAYIRFMTYGIPVAAVIHAILIGSIVAVLAKGRELVATITLAIFLAVPIGWLYFLFVRWAPQLPVVPALTFVLLHRAPYLTAAVVGGVIVRICRSSEASRLQVP